MYGIRPARTGTPPTILEFSEGEAVGLFYRWNKHLLLGIFICFFLTGKLTKSFCARKLFFIVDDSLKKPNDG